MSSYLLCENTDEKTINSLNLDNAYEITMRKSKELKKITIYDETIIRNFVIKKVTANYQKVLIIVKDVMESDDASESDCMLALDEIYRLKDILFHKYRIYLKEKQYELFLERLLYLENVLQKKILEYQRNDEIIMKGR